MECFHTREALFKYESMFILTSQVPRGAPGDTDTECKCHEGRVSALFISVSPEPTLGRGT